MITNITFILFGEFIWKDYVVAQDTRVLPRQLAHLVKNYFTPVLGVGFHYRAPNYFFGIGMPTLFQSERFDDTQDWKTSAVDYSYVHFTGGINLKVQESLKLNTFD